jgi:hypothetical protein
MGLLPRHGTRSSTHAQALLWTHVWDGTPTTLQDECMWHCSFVCAIGFNWSCAAAPCNQLYTNRGYGAANAAADECPTHHMPGNAPDSATPSMSRSM